MIIGNVRIFGSPGSELARFEQQLVTDRSIDSPGLHAMQARIAIRLRPSASTTATGLLPASASAGSRGRADRWLPATPRGHAAHAPRIIHSLANHARARPQPVASDPPPFLPFPSPAQFARVGRARAEKRRAPYHPPAGRRAPRG
jgi:hypothetical protein